MAKYFLGSVGEVEAYEVSTTFAGETSMKLAFTSKSLTDSAVNISVNKEQIVDSYNGAPAGVFYHSPNITITLSDIMWRPDYLEAALGMKFGELCENGDIEYYQIEVQTNEDGYYDFSGTSYKLPVKTKLPGVSDENSPYVVIGRLFGETEWYDYPYDGTNYTIGKDSSISDLSSSIQGVLKPNSTYCFRYAVSSNQSRALQITTNIVPAELFLVITTPLFVADCADSSFESSTNLPENMMVSTGKRVGKVVYEVPRWALDGDATFNFAMSNTSGMQLSGIVLESIDNEEEPTFMRLREIIKTRVWYEGLTELFWDGDGISNSTADFRGHIYGIYSDGSYSAIDFVSSSFDSSELKLVIKPIGASTSSGSTYTYDDVEYNISGQFSAFTAGYVYPAVLWTDENNEETLLILEEMGILIN